MRFFYRLSEDRGGWRAEAEGIDALVGRGGCPETAVLDLRAMLDSLYEAAVGHRGVPPGSRLASPIGSKRAREVVRSPIMRVAA